MNEPLYKVIYTDLKNAILDSTYPIGTQIPTNKELTKKYDVSMITIKKAMDLLKEDQLISRTPRKGTFVTQNKIESFPPDQINTNLPLIGLIFTDFDDYFGSKVLKSIMKCSDGKAQIIFKISEGDPEKEEKKINELIELGVEGIILVPASSKFISPRLLQLVSTNFPLVLVDRSMDRLPSCNVQIDNNTAASHLIEHLFENGHKRIGIITPENHITTLEERINGAISAHIKNHVSLNQSQMLTNLHSVIPNSQVPPRHDIDKIKLFLEREKDITALFAGEYAIVLLIEQAVEELNKNVYTDYSVVCFDHPQNRIIDKQSFVFTHILQDQDEIGKNSFELLFKKIKNPSLVEKINAPYYLVEGMSVKDIRNSKSK